MNRREAIKRTSLMLGVAASSSAVISLLNGCVPKKTINWKPTFFTEDQALLVAEIAETILPKTNTPGALDVGVDAFIDYIVGSCYAPEEQEIFIKGLNEVQNQSKELGEDSFMDLDADKKVDVLTKLEMKASPIQTDFFQADQPFFKQVKELTLLGYFTSEDIMKNHLEYVPIPTRLEGCVDMKENQKLIVGNHV